MPADPGLGTPRDFVQSGWDYMRNLSSGYVLLAQQALYDISALTITPIEFDSSFEFTADYGSFVRPVAPVVTDLGEVDVTLPTVPTAAPIAMRELGSAPVEPDFSGMIYTPPAAPTIDFPTAPSDINPVLTEVEIPAAPDFESYLPALPALYELNLPADLLITLPEFSGTRPVIDLDAYRPDRVLNWQEVAYSSELLDTVKSHLTTMIQGGLGLPANVEQAIFDRGRVRADLAGSKSVQEAADVLAGRGLTDGGPYLGALLDQARMAGRQEVAGLNRDLTIMAAEKEIESIRFALTQAGALEATLLQVNSQLNQRALDAAKIASDIQVAVFNAAVTAYNLDVELFKADAGVYRDLIQGELAKAEVYKAQIEGQKAIGQVNEALIRAYAAQIDSVKALADIYRAQVEAARAAGEINVQRLEQARLKIQVFGSQVDAYGKAQDAYKTGIEASLGNVRVFEAIGNVYGQRVQAYKTTGEAYFREGEFQIQQQTLGFDAYKAALEGVKVQLAEQSAAIDARARTFSARATMYQAEGSIIAAEAASNDRNAQLRIEAAKMRRDVLLEVTKARADQNVQIYGLYLEQLKTKAQVVSQLAAATLSGVNFGASYNGSLTVGTSYGVGFNYSGDAVSDLNPPYVPFVSF